MCVRHLLVSLPWLLHFKIRSFTQAFVARPMQCLANFVNQSRDSSPNSIKSLIFNKIKIRESSQIFKQLTGFIGIYATTIRKTETLWRQCKGSKCIAISLPPPMQDIADQPLGPCLFLRSAQQSHTQPELAQDRGPACYDSCAIF